MASGVAVWVCRGGPFYSSSPVPNAYLGLAKAGVLPTGSLCMQKYEINRVVSWWRGSNMVPATGGCHVYGLPQGERSKKNPTVPPRISKVRDPTAAGVRPERMSV